MQFLFMLLLLLTAVFLILLVLVQRGRGGGLAGAFGGMGGQSAFGTKAGDLFTRITIVVATIWILLCIVAVRQFGSTDNAFDANLGSAAPSSNLPGAADGNTTATPSATKTGTPAAETPATGSAPAGTAPAKTPEGK
jgi:preprotein translocase subunit SecG